jgi:UDP-GlcNAc:undecaprenyl-phosphate GlcNAc-1-phosphate transferase
MNWLVALAAVPSFVIAWTVALVLCRLAPKWGFVDRPGERKIHKTPIAFGGSLAIWAGVVTTFAATEWLLIPWSRAYREDPASARLDLSFAGQWGRRLAEFVEPHLPGLVAQSADLWFFLACGSVLVVLGLIDDTRNLDWRLRLAVEILVAGAVVIGRGWKLTLFVEWPILTDAVSVLWIVGLINSFNMLDNMDGLSAGVAAIAAAILASVMLLTPEGGSGTPQLFVAGVLFVLVGALVGFLIHNRPPARIIMGDAGAYFVGFSLAVMTILATFSGNGAPRHAILAPLCVLAVPIYDTLSVVVIRLRAGRSPFAGDTNHFSHRLVALGLSKPQAVLTIYLTTAACGLGALLLHQVDFAGAIVILLMIACLLAVVAILEVTARRKSGP